MKQDSSQLIFDYLDDELTDDGQKALIEWLEQDPRNVDRFVMECRFHSGLLRVRSRWRKTSACTGSGCGVQGAGLSDGRMGKGERRAAEALSPKTQDPRPLSYPSSLIPYPSSAPPSPLSLLPSLTGGVGLCYAVALLILAAGVMAARLWSPSDDPQQLVSSVVSSPIQLVSSPAQPPADSGPTMIGRITAMSKCRWADAGSAMREGAPVPAHHAFALVSGLVEITYYTGAKVILEGPAVYLADGANGGALRLGRLTVSTGKLDRAQLESEAKAHSLPAPPPHVAAFRVRTPAALLTDNGQGEIKFGVEVTPAKTTYLRVFRGSLALRAPGFQPYLVPEDYCVWTGAGPNHDGLLVFRPKHETATFVLEVPKSPPVCVAKPGSKQVERSSSGGG